MEENRGEGSQGFLKGGQAGVRGGCLKMGAGTPLQIVYCGASSEIIFGQK